MLFALPLIGVIAYVIVRPKGAASNEHAPKGRGGGGYYPSDRIGPMGPRV